MSEEKAANSVSTTVKIKPKEKKRRGLFLFQILLVVGFLLLIWLSFGQNVLQLGEDGVSKRLGELKLVSKVAGAEALTQINKLHGTNIKVIDAYIASYSGDGARVMVWVGTAEDNNAAAELIGRMVEGISRGNASFTNLRRLTINQGYHSHEIFQVDGPGGKHFFFLSKQSQDRIVWLTLEADDTLPILKQVLNTF